MHDHKTDTNTPSNKVIFGCLLRVVANIKLLNNRSWYDMCFCWMQDVEKGCSSHENGCDGTTGIWC